jgi:hypothetical protein
VGYKLFGTDRLLLLVPLSASRLKTSRTALSTVTSKLQALNLTMLQFQIKLTSSVILK